MSKGLTMVEIIITVFVISVAVIGVYSAFSLVVILTADVEDSFTASYLAQEGIEIVRNIRDQNWLNQQNWYGGLDGCSEGCQGDYMSSIPPNAGLSIYTEGGKLLKDGNEFYSYSSGGSASRFSRKITIDCIPSDCTQSHILKVVSEVSWDKKSTILSPQGYSAGNCSSGYNCVKVEEYLYDWY